MAIVAVGHHPRERERRRAIRAPAERPAIRLRDLAADARRDRPARGGADAERKAEAAEQQVARDRELRQPVEQRRLERRRRRADRGVAEHDPAQPVAPRPPSRTRPIGPPQSCADEDERPGRQLIDRAPSHAPWCVERCARSAPACSTGRARSDRGRSGAARRRPAVRGSRRRPCATGSPTSGCRGRAGSRGPSAGPHSSTCMRSPSDRDHRGREIPAAAARRSSAGSSATNRRRGSMALRRPRLPRSAAGAALVAVAILLVALAAPVAARRATTRWTAEPARPPAEPAAGRTRRAVAAATAGRPP